MSEKMYAYALEMSTEQHSIVEMGRSQLPELVRIKRKRNQNSLEALIFEGPKHKRSKDDLYVFKLQRTDDKMIQQEQGGDEILPLLQESENHTYLIPKLQPEDQKLPAEFTEMLDSVLNVDQLNTDSKNLKKRKRRTSLSANKILNNENPFDLDYVYDVYYRDKAVQETWERSKIGYIKFEEDADDILNEDDNSDNIQLSDDEDSNAESFYQNDYPEDEDAGNIGDDIEREKSESEQEDQVAVVNDEYDEIYDRFFQSAKTNDFLGSLDKHSDEEDYQRQNFFPNEEDDELAQHRDRIFGKLQKMIREADD